MNEKKNKNKKNEEKIKTKSTNENIEILPHVLVFPDVPLLIKLRFYSSSFETAQEVHGGVLSTLKTLGDNVHGAIKVTGGVVSVRMDAVVAHITHTDGIQNFMDELYRLKDMDVLSVEKDRAHSGAVCVCVCDDPPCQTLIEDVAFNVINKIIASHNMNVERLDACFIALRCVATPVVSNSSEQDLGDVNNIMLNRIIQDYFQMSHAHTHTDRNSPLDVVMRAAASSSADPVGGEAALRALLNSLLKRVGHTQTHTHTHTHKHTKPKQRTKQKHKK
eukprot:GHVR01148133.1.p1 GENE.GHVR01148133.1~~GHVR01148133.1.p1  ORF type:complete len:276 (-),score=106.51 GHVR01148133.1:368-1195(-)